VKLEEAVHPRLLQHVGDVRGFIEDMGVNPHKMDGARNHFLETVAYDLSHYIERQHNFYFLRLLTEEGADYFLGVADQMAPYFSPNLDEGKEYQIPEVMLDMYSATNRANLLAREIGKEVLWPLFHVMYGNPPNHFSSVQLARYSAPDNIGTGWHADTESEASCVVSLAPERHKGGGTLLMPYGAFGQPYHLGPLPKGSALLFNGRTTLHRGVELEEGERNLLVYWMNAI